MSKFWPVALALVLVAGASPADSQHKHEAHDHGDESHHAHEGHEDCSHHHHAHVAPHGGTLVVLGDHFLHAEFVLDSATGKLTAWILDGEAEKSVRVDQEALSLTVKVGEEEYEVALQAVANLLTGEKAGDTSEFSASVEALRGVASFDAVLTKLRAKGQALENVSFSYPEGNE